MTDRELMQMALDALELTGVEYLTQKEIEHLDALEIALRAALAQPQQEPVAYLCENAVGHKYFRWKKPSSEYKPIALYTAHDSPQRIWQGLTDKEIENCFEMSMFGTCRAIEAKLKEKNG